MLIRMAMVMKQVRKGISSAGEALYSLPENITILSIQRFTMSETLPTLKICGKPRLDSERCKIWHRVSFCMVAYE